MKTAFTFDLGLMPLSRVAKNLNNHRILAFGGAGISRDSGLPIANELTNEVLSCIKISEESKRVLDDARPPFELFIETLAACSDVTPLYEIYGGGEPCTFHHMCAKLSLEGRLAGVLTTNFDCLFERIFEAQKVPYVRFWREVDYKIKALPVAHVLLIKIHGSAHDHSSLGATIRQVANQRGVSVRNEALQMAFFGTSAELVLVAGYSGSDRFDINPFLTRLSNLELPVVLVAHNSGVGDSALIETLTYHSKAGPFSGFKGIRIECDATRLFQAMQNKRSTNKSNASGQDWSAKVSEWLDLAVKKHGLAIRPYVCGALLRASSQPKEALSWFLKAEKLVASQWLDIEIRLSIARCKRDTETDRADAFKFARGALLQARRVGITKLEMKALIELGVLAADTKNYEQALRHYKLAENLARQIDDIEAIGITIGNAAIVRKNLGGTRRFKRALRDYEESLQIARRLGDKRSEGRTIGNLGILHSVMGNPLRAIEHFKKATDIAGEIGDRYHEAIWLVCQGDDSFSFDPAGAIDLVRKGREIFLEIGSNVRALDCDAHLRRFGL